MVLGNLFSGDIRPSYTYLVQVGVVRPVVLGVETDPAAVAATTTVGCAIASCSAGWCVQVGAVIRCPGEEMVQEKGLLNGSNFAVSH